MKLKQKAAIGSVVSIFALGLVANLSLGAQPIEATEETNEITLAHNAYVYNKHGKRLSKFQGSKQKAHLKKGLSVPFVGKIEPIEHNDKQFYLLNDDNYHQSWLPYHKIGGEYFYSLGSGGFVKAVNVGQVNNKPLYTHEAKVKIAKKVKPYTAGIGKDKTVIKPGKTYRVDSIAALTTDSKPVVNYRISGTIEAFIPKKDLAVIPRQNLKLYTQATYVGFLKTAGTYDITATALPTESANSTFNTGDMYPVEKLTYLWNSSEKKAELFYLLKDSWAKPRFYSLANYQPAATPSLTYVKVEGTNYISGPYLKPNNTPEQAQADAKIATKEDKQKLQTLVDQELITPYQKDNNFTLCGFRFGYALQLAQNTLKSEKATIAEVKEATAILQKAHSNVLNCTPKQEKGDQLLGTSTPYLLERQNFIQ